MAKLLSVIIHCLMATTHIAHDCIVGNNVIMANIATLGEVNVEIGDWCNIGGGSHDSSIRKGLESSH